MVHTRDLVSGFSVLVVAGWFARTTGVGGGRPALIVAIAGCAVAGVAYLGAAAIDEQRTRAGVNVSHGWARGLAGVSLGVAIVALGVDGVAGGLDALSAVLIVGGSLAVVAGGLRMRHRWADSSGADADGQTGSDEES